MVTTYEEYNAEVVKCDFCGKDTERQKMKLWTTGSRLCPGCYRDTEDKRSELIESLRNKMGNTGDMGKADKKDRAGSVGNIDKKGNTGKIDKKGKMGKTGQTTLF